MDNTVLSQAGWTLTNIEHRDALGNNYPAAIVMYDDQGYPVWYHVNGSTPDTRGDVSADYLDNGNILIGAEVQESPREIDLAGSIVWEGPGQDLNSPYPMTHNTGKLSNGHYVVLRDYQSPTFGVIGPLIQELDATNQVVWSWNMFDHVTPPSNAYYDWCHANAVTVDLVNDVFYLSCRWLGVFKVNRSGTQAIIWQLAALTGAMPGTMQFDPPAGQMTDQHDPEIHSDGTILLFDNGGWDGYPGVTPNPHRHSRVLEFAVDEAAQVASLDWEFPGNFNVDPWYQNDFYLPCWGSAKRLANSNILVAAGVMDTVKQTRFFEVTRAAGNVVWEIELPPNNGSYRAQRISPPPRVQPMN